MAITPVRHYALILLLLLSQGVAASPSEDPSPLTSCDPDIKPLPHHPYGYRLRADRCEGLYEQPLAASGALRLVSFIRTPNSVDPNWGNAMTLHWPIAGDAPIAIRAQALRRKFYYRMDATFATRASSYSWPTDLLKAIELNQYEIGLLAWTTEQISGRTQTVYLPVTIGAHRGSITSDYILQILSGQELTEVYLTISRLLPTGEEIVRAGQPLALGFYPAQHPILVALPKLGEAGLYRVEISASLDESGGAVAIQFAFRHSHGVVP